MILIDRGRRGMVKHPVWFRPLQSFVAPGWFRVGVLQEMEATIVRSLTFDRCEGSSAGIGLYLPPIVVQRPVPLRGDESIDKTHLFRFVAFNSSTVEDHVERMGVADEAGKTNRSTVNERDSPPSTVNTKHRRLGGHSQIAPKR
jgi:hypothetical protein